MYRTRSADIYTSGANAPVQKTHVFVGEKSSNATFFLIWIFLPVFYVAWLWIDAQWFALDLKWAAADCLNGVSSACGYLVMYQWKYESTLKMFHDNIRDIPMMMFGMLVLYGGASNFVYVAK